MSAGNAGKSFATLAKAQGIDAVVVMPDSVPSERKAAIEALGATVELAPLAELQKVCIVFTRGSSRFRRLVLFLSCVSWMRASFTCLETESAVFLFLPVVIFSNRRALSNAPQVVDSHVARGRRFVHPYDDMDLIAGHGTVGLEILEDFPDVDVVLVCCGGGGLVAGVATAIKTAPAQVHSTQAAHRDGPTPRPRSLEAPLHVSSSSSAATAATTASVPDMLAEKPNVNLEEGLSAMVKVGVAAKAKSARVPAIGRRSLEKQQNAHGGTDEPSPHERVCRIARPKTGGLGVEVGVWVCDFVWV